MTKNTNECKNKFYYIGRHIKLPKIKIYKDYNITRFEMYTTEERYVFFCKRYDDCYTVWLVYIYNYEFM